MANDYCDVNLCDVLHLHIPQFHPLITRSKGTKALSGEDAMYLLAVIGSQRDVVYLHM